jgi:prepilin-type N-terminal cleavage/methylation domain-containing protein
MNRTHRPGAPRGFTLLEVMIALTILLVGLLGMMRLQIIGISSNNGGRLQTVGTELAQELVTGLERLPFGDPLLAVTGTAGPAAPTPFGRLVAGAEIAEGGLTWADGSAVPGVRLDTELPPGFTRRWTVWGYSPSSGALPAVKVVAVSVTWREPALALPREVVLYTQLVDPGAIVSNLAANL